MIEMKSFLFLLVKNFVFAPTEDKIVKQNVYVHSRLTDHVL